MSTAPLRPLRLRALQEPTSQALVKHLAQMHQQDTMSTAPLRPLRLRALQEPTSQALARLHALMRPLEIM